MGKIRKFSATIAAVGLIASPVSAQSSMPKNAPPSGQASAQSAQNTIPILPLPSFDRETAEYKIAHDIAVISMPEDMFNALMAREIPPMMYSLFKEMPEMQALDNEHPGYTRHMATAISDFMLPRMYANYAFFVDAQARDLVKEFNLAELQEILAIYQSPFGQKIVSFGYENLTFDTEVMSESILTENDALMDKAVTVAPGKARQLAGSLSDEELKQMFALLQSPLFQRLKRVNAASTAGAWDEGMDALFSEAEVATVFVRADEAFFKEQDGN